MFARVGTLVLILAYINFVSSFDSRNIVFVIVSQPEPYHASVASLLKQDIEGQILEIDKILPRVHLTHIDFPSPGAWTVIPLLRPLVARYKGSDVRWVLFVEPHTAVRCSQLLDALAAADQQKETMWIGYPLSDDEPTIIHHFTFYEDLEEEGGFVYPNFASGFAMRMELIEGLLYKVESGERKLEADFSIDPAYELAQLIYGGGSDPGPLLTPDLSFCIVSGDNCATYPRQFDTCGSAIPEESVFFAVKTWSGFHGTRARVVKKTWGRYVTHLQFYSDKDGTSFRLLYKVESGERKLEADFSIDPAYELAQLIYGGGSDPGPLLTPDLSFCIVSGDNCATYPRQFDTCVSTNTCLI
ncbi:beta-1,3-glucosyltransferase-like [Ostrinia furnacalis]|uniref:beta-1,3-glucosyltransferase-like n=1 Tax=Ostrinia furnacalis TaxID=93504 RepID=UPI00103ED88B|nr:beta-1,3-glucosyltransferase-like [Ostrinia furnacalis]